MLPKTELRHPCASAIVTHRFAELEVSDADFIQLTAIARWQEMPWFPTPGRTAWYMLSKPVLGDYPWPLLAAKIKGVGIWNPDVEGYSGVHTSERAPEPQQPTLSTYAYTSQIPHIGFDENGMFIVAYSEEAPYGGMLHRRAVSEFENATTLFQERIPATVPVAVVQYPDLVFNGEALGAIITLSPTSEPYRMHPFLMGDAGLDVRQVSYYNSILNALNVDGNISDPISRLRALQILGLRIGRAIRDFARAGLYRHSGGLDNLMYYPVADRVILTDLDSSRQLAELLPEVRALQCLRDLASVLFKVLYRLAYPSQIQLYSLADLLEHDPLTPVLEGYFPEAGNLICKELAEKLWRLYIPHLIQLRCLEIKLPKNQFHNLRESLLMDRDLFYILAITLCFPLFHSSGLWNLYPCSINLSELMARATAYLQDRSDYFLYLCGACR